MAPFRLSCLGPPVLYGPDGDPIRFRTRNHFALLLYLAVEPGIPHRRDRLATLLWSAADVDEAGAALTVRDFDDDAPRVIPRDRWRFAREEGGEVVPDGEHFWLADGFEPGKIYELVYTTDRAPVVGCGLLAIRDVASFLKHDVTADLALIPF